MRSFCSTKHIKTIFQFHSQKFCYFERPNSLIIVYVFDEQKLAVEKTVWVSFTIFVTNFALVLCLSFFFNYAVWIFLGYPVLLYYKSIRPPWSHQSVVCYKYGHFRGHSTSPSIRKGQICSCIWPLSDMKNTYLVKKPDFNRIWETFQLQIWPAPACIWYEKSRSQTGKYKPYLRNVLISDPKSKNPISPDQNFFVRALAIVTRKIYTRIYP